MRSVLFALVVSLVLMLPCAAGEIPESLHEYIKTVSETIEFRDIRVPGGSPAVAETITRAQAREDIETLAYLFQNGYSGREFYEMRGVDFQRIYQGLREAVEQFDEPVRVQDLENRIAAAFGEIFDGHLSIRGHRSHRFYRHQDIYYGDVLVEEQNGAFVVIQSAVSAIQAGDRFTQDDPQRFLFRTLSPEGKEHSLVGVLSDAYVPQQPLSFNGKEIRVPLHASRLSQATKPRDICTLTQCDGVDVLNMQRFPPSPMTGERVEPYIDMARSLKDRSVFILDVRSNPGGSSQYSQAFFQTLNRVAHWRKSSAVLRSPVTGSSGGWAKGLSNLWSGLGGEKRYTRTWDMYAGLEAQQMGDYPGRVIVLMDRHVASSGEAAVAYSKSVRDSLRVGENTGGIGTFGEVRRYYLPHSGIRVNLPCKLFVCEELLEGRGYLPDIWLDTSQPIEEIVRWLNDPQGYRVAFPEPLVLQDMDFERWSDGTPEYASKQVGATNNPQGKHARVVRDTTTKTQGQSSVRFSGDAETGIWYSLQQQVPPGLGSLHVRYAVKGQNLRREANQFTSCYVGFIYQDGTGRRHFHIQSYRDTFDWKEDEITLDCRDKFEIIFAIFSNISGDFWVDDVRFDQE